MYWAMLIMLALGIGIGYALGRNDGEKKWKVTTAGLASQYEGES